MKTPHQAMADLITAAQAVLHQAENGELFAHSEPAVSNNVRAFDQLDAAVKAAAERLGQPSHALQQ